jgi:hypothetical protein
MLLPDEIRKFIMRNEGATEKRSNIDIKNELIAKYPEYIKKINDYYELKKATTTRSSPPGSSPVPDPTADPTADLKCKNPGCTIARHRTRKARSNKRKIRRTRKTN